MAAPREVLGPYPPRGLTDLPEKSPYGCAALAENVEFYDGWMSVRGGTRLWNTTAATLAGLDVKRVLYAREFRGRNNSPLLVLVYEYETGGGVRYLSLDVCTPGVSGSVLTSEQYTAPHASFQPTAFEFGEALYISMPAGADGVTWRKVTHTAPYISAHQYNNTGSSVVDEEGPFFDVGFGDKLLAQFGVVYSSRVWYAGYPDGKVRFSAVIYPGLVSTLNEAGPCGPPTALAAFAKSLLIFTQYSVETLTEFGGQGDIQLQPFLQHTGAVNHNAVVQAGHRLFFLSDSGLLAMDQQGNIEEVSEAIRNTLRAHQPDFANAQLVHYPTKHQLWLTLPSSNVVYVMSLQKSGRYYNWSTFVLGRSATEWASPSCVALSRNGAEDTPILGVLNESEEASFIMTQHGEPGDNWYPA